MRWKCLSTTSRVFAVFKLWRYQRSFFNSWTPSPAFHGLLKQDPIQRTYKVCLISVQVLEYSSATWFGNDFIYRTPVVLVFGLLYLSWAARAFWFRSIIGQALCPPRASLRDWGPMIFLSTSGLLFLGWGNLSLCSPIHSDYSFLIGSWCWQTRVGQVELLDF